MLRINKKIVNGLLFTLKTLNQEDPEEKNPQKIIFNNNFLVRSVNNIGHVVNMK